MLASEADMSSLSLCRQPLGKQLAVFFAVSDKFMSIKVGIGCDFHRASALSSDD